jgi:hypothetical protein
VFQEGSTGFVSIQSVRSDAEQRATAFCDGTGKVKLSPWETTANPPYILVFVGQVAAHPVFHRPLWHGLWHRILFCPRTSHSKCRDHRERRTRRGVGGCRVYGGGSRDPAGLGSGAGPHGRLPVVIAAVAAVHCATFRGGRLLAPGGVTADPDARFRGRGCRKFEPTASGVQEILSLVVCFGMAGVYWRTRHILFDGGEAEILNRRSSLGSGRF